LAFDASPLQVRDSEEKVFCFFFSKKKFLLSLWQIF